jgi:hypothetical protein
VRVLAGALLHHRSPKSAFLCLADPSCPPSWLSQLNLRPNIRLPGQKTGSRWHPPRKGWSDGDENEGSL